MGYKAANRILGAGLKEAVAGFLDDPRALRTLISGNSFPGEGADRAPSSVTKRGLQPQV